MYHTYLLRQTTRKLKWKRLRLCTFYPHLPQNNVSKREDIELSLKQGTPYEETKVEFSNSFDFKGQQLNKGLSREAYLPVIKEQYPDQDIDALVNQFRTAFNNNPKYAGRTLNDAALLALLHGYLER